MKVNCLPHYVLKGAVGRHHKKLWPTRRGDSRQLFNTKAPASRVHDETIFLPGYRLSGGYVSSDRLRDSYDFLLYSI